MSDVLVINNFTLEELRALATYARYSFYAKVVGPLGDVTSKNRFPWDTILRLWDEKHKFKLELDTRKKTANIIIL